MKSVVEGTVNEGTLKVALSVKRLDAAAARDFKERMDALWSEEVSQVEFDCSAVEFIDSSGVGALLSVYRRLPGKERQVFLESVQAPVQSVIELLRLHKILRIAS